MYQKTRLCLLLTAFLFLTTGTVIAQQEKSLLLGTDFQFKGKWFNEVNKDGISGNILRFLEGEQDSTSDALTVMNIGKAGRYTI